MTGDWDRLSERLPEEWARVLADRLEQLEGARAGAILELHINVHEGRIVDLRWDPDERIPLTIRLAEPNLEPT